MRLVQSQDALQENVFVKALLATLPALRLVAGSKNAPREFDRATWQAGYFKSTYAWFDKWLQTRQAERCGIFCGLHLTQAALVQSQMVRSDTCMHVVDNKSTYTVVLKLLL